MISIPFNFQPIDNKETSTSYTVPTGKYARVVVTLSATAYVSSISYTSTDGLVASANDSNSTTVEMWLKAGESVTKTETSASASGSGAESVDIDSQSVAAVLVNSVEVARIEASSFVSGRVAAASTIAAAISGTANVDWQIAEFNVIS